MDSDDLIATYLAELDSELRLPRRLRRRIVAEAGEHLRESASRAAAPGAAGQAQAIEGFGPPAEVAADFARELAVGSTRRAVGHGGLLFVLSLVLWDLCTSSFVHVAPGWINDGPGSALLWILGQVGLVAGSVSLARARVARRAKAPDPARLRYAVRGLLVLVACTALTVALTGAGVAISLTHPGTHPGAGLLGVLITACAAVTAMSAVTVWQAHKRLWALAPLPPTTTGREALDDVVDTVGWGFMWVAGRVPMASSAARRISVSWGPAARRALSPFDPLEHRWRYGCGVALLAGLAVAALDLILLIVRGQLESSQLNAFAATAPALIAVEAALVLCGYALLGGYLGLRPTRARGSA